MTLVVVWAERTPQVGEQLAEDCVRAHVTPCLLVSFVTVAVKERALEVETETEEGETETDAVAVRVMVADAFFELLETEVAVRVTVAGFGSDAGAV